MPRQARLTPIESIFTGLPTDVTWMESVPDCKVPNDTTPTVLCFVRLEWRLTLAIVEPFQSTDTVPQRRHLSTDSVNVFACTPGRVRRDPCESEREKVPW